MEKLPLVFLNIQGTRTGKKTWKETQLANMRGRVVKPSVALAVRDNSKLSKAIEHYSLILATNHSFALFP